MYLRPTGHLPSASLGAMSPDEAAATGAVLGLALGIGSIVLGGYAAQKIIPKKNEGLRLIGTAVGGVAGPWVALRVLTSMAPKLPPPPGVVQNGTVV